MKKTILILLMVMPISIFAQTYTISVDTVQNFKHDVSLSYNSAIISPLPVEIFTFDILYFF
jgi:hypothetical protein